MIQRIVKLILRVLFRVEVSGTMPGNPPERLLIISNHQSFLDAFLIGAFVSNKVTWVIHSQIWAQWHFRVLIRWTNHVIVDTSRPQAIRTLIRTLEQGRPVVIFPEGRVTTTGGLMKVYDGPAFLAAKTGAAILPVSIDGAVHTALSRMKPPFPLMAFPKIRITIRSLEKIPMPEARTGKLRRRIASDRMQRILEESRYQSRLKKTIPRSVPRRHRSVWSDAVVLDDVRQEGQTYAHLLKASLALGRLAGRLAAENEVAGLLLPNAGTTVCLLMGMFMTRRIPAMLNYASGVEGMQTACDAARIRTIITSRGFLEKARLAEKVAQLRGVAIVYLEDLRIAIRFLR